jgi:DNA-directed RNA polymerase specialized sigma24 family protein
MATHMENLKHDDWYEWQDIKKGTIDVTGATKPSLEKRILKFVIFKCAALGQPAMAHDLSQTILLWLIEKDKYRGEASVETYLNKIVPHALYRMIRKNRVNLQDELKETVPDKRCEEIVEAIERRISSDKTLSELSKSCKELQLRIIKVVENCEDEKISRREVGRQLQEDGKLTRYEVEKALNQLGKAMKKLGA